MLAGRLTQIWCLIQLLQAVNNTLLRVVPGKNVNRSTHLKSVSYQTLCYQLAAVRRRFSNKQPTWKPSPGTHAGRKPHNDSENWGQTHEFCMFSCTRPPNSTKPNRQHLPLTVRVRQSTEITCYDSRARPDQSATRHPRTAGPRIKQI